MDATLEFHCLDPRKAKRDQIEKTLSQLGNVHWLKTVPLKTKGFAESEHRAKEAFNAARKKPRNRAAAAAKLALFRTQYNGSRAFFERNPRAVAVAWNGLNGSRRVFMDGARDAGVRTLYFELGPLPGRITVDPCGVNYLNGLPRDASPYMRWAQEHGAEGWRTVRDTIRARQGANAESEPTPERSMSEPYLFVPLQVPGDSQLRLFGGAFRTVETVIEAIAEAADHLPEGWHMRIKEHPTSPVRYGDVIAQLTQPNVVLDNGSDTFEQVAKSQAVVTVNSSVGLEAMFYEKPVVALGNCFWAIPGIAKHCPSTAALAETLAHPDELGFDPSARAAFLSFLTEEYYPRLNHDDERGRLHPEEISKVSRRLEGPNELGFWSRPIELAS